MTVIEHDRLVARYRQMEDHLLDALDERELTPTAIQALHQVLGERLRDQRSKILQESRAQLNPPIQSGFARQPPLAETGPGNNAEAQLDPVLVEKHTKYFESVSDTILRDWLTRADSIEAETRHALLQQIQLRKAAIAHWGNAQASDTTAAWINAYDENISFQWWHIWALLNLILGNLVLLGLFHDAIVFALFSVAIHTALMIFVLRLSKVAFLISTIISLNPLWWIINGIYLKNRWDHPKVNGRR